MDNKLITEAPLGSQPSSALIAVNQPAAAESGMAEISSLLKELNQVGSDRYVPPSLPLTNAEENQLVQVRLGVASSLFTSLRLKHEPTAQHSLRVTLACSAWALKMGLSAAFRDELELAALLHDIGKIGVPDSVLGKPGRLTPQEAMLMEKHWAMGRDILISCCASQNVIDAMGHARAWFDGSKGSFELSGDAIPLAARMLSVADAFDAMTSDQVYRRAMSRETAFNELYEYAGSQFDPNLVGLFHRLHDCDQLKLQEQVARQWLRSLDQNAASSDWQLQHRSTAGDHSAPDPVFQQKLLETMYDAVIFVDTGMKILLWNRGAERLTGVTSASVLQRRLAPSLLHMQDELGLAFADENCPVAHAVETGVQWLRRLSIRGRGNRQIAVDAHAVPVVSAEGLLVGLTLLLHDVSPEITLEERCQALHEKATKDPLTQVANRAEFDRLHELFIAAHLESRCPCSLIISDIDRFKLVNDTYGHQAGDQVIQSFANLLKNACRPGDLAARYGGEEFVLLFADCDNAGAVRRAEELRKSFGAIKQSALDGRPVTASFGVTEVQPGDTPETMLRRADRALLNAKENGRNTVVQLGSGTGAAAPAGAGRSKIGRGSSAALVELDLVSAAPLYVSIEKLRGFIADHHAEIETIDGNEVRLIIGDDRDPSQRRGNDRPARFLMEVQFTEERQAPARPLSGPERVRTRIHLVIRPRKARERRVADVTDRAKQLATSFRAYLMASDAEIRSTPTANLGLLQMARRWLNPWSHR